MPLSPNTWLARSDRGSALRCFRILESALSLGLQRFLLGVGQVAVHGLAGRQAGAPTHGQQAAAPGSLQTQPGHSYVSTLTKPVHRPASGKRTVLPRTASGPRVPSGQPVNRNLPYARQETLQALTQDQLQGTGAAQGAPVAAADKPSAGG